MDLGLHATNFNLTFTPKILRLIAGLHSSAYSLFAKGVYNLYETRNKNKTTPFFFKPQNKITLASCQLVVITNQMHPINHHSASQDTHSHIVQNQIFNLMVPPPPPHTHTKKKNYTFITNYQKLVSGFSFYKENGETWITKVTRGLEK